MPSVFPYYHDLHIFSLKTSERAAPLLVHLQLVEGRKQQVKAWRLDLVLVPLVGFDPQGNRLGMGGGFYDRTFAYRGRRKHTSRPCLIGLAHECQRVEHLPCAGWDIPLDGVITDCRRY